MKLNMPFYLSLMCVFIYLLIKFFFTVHNCNIILVLSDRSVFQKNGKRAELKIQIMIFFFL